MLHPILVPPNIRIKIGINLFGSLKQKYGYKYIVIAVGYKSKFVEAEPLKERSLGVMAKFVYKLLC